MGHEVEKLRIWPQNILSVQTTRGGRRRGGQGGINTAGFNIRSKARHFALYRYLPRESGGSHGKHP